MSTEGGSLGAVLITETVVWGVLGAIGVVGYLWASSKDERPKPTDDRAAVCAKKVRITRRNMLLYATIGFWAVFVGALLSLFKIGTTERPDDVLIVNWTYLVLTAIAWAALAILHGLYFWFPWFGQTAALAVLWGASFVLLAVGPLSTSNTKRDVCFGLAVALQGLSVVHVLWFQGRMGPLFRLRGWLTVIWVLLAFALFDIFWYIGYLNADRGATQLTSPWKTHLPFFLANVVGLVVSAAVAAWTYKAKSSDIDDIISEVHSDVSGAVEGGIPLSQGGSAAYDTASGSAAF